MKQYKEDGLNVIEFQSIADFTNYIQTTEPNATFSKRSDRQSEQTNSSSERFTQTKSFGEAMDLLTTGWSVTSKKISQKLKAKSLSAQAELVTRNVLAVAGHQPIVPLYLNGSPVNMVSQRRVPVRQKVVTINKSSSYSAAVSTETIIEDSTEALQIVQQLESNGTRVNLNMCYGTQRGSRRYLIKIRIKNASERLNVSKMAFPMIHPSMLRRMIFRFIEVHPGVPQSFLWGYGSPIDDTVVKANVEKHKEYLIPKHISTDIDKIKDIGDIC